MIWNFCIKRPVFTVVIFLVAGIFGIQGFLRMPVQENPDVEFPVVSVNVMLPGASPSVVESELVEPLEAEINTIEGLRRLTSTAGEHVATIIAEFELWQDIDVAAQDVRDAVDRAGRLLPREAEAPIVNKLDIGAQAIMWVTLTGDERWDEIRLTDYAENHLKRQLETLRGVGRIQIGGSRNYAARIRLDPSLLAAHQITVGDVVRTIQANNVDIPSGRVEGGRREFLIQTRGQFSSAEPFNDMIITHRNGAPVRISDVGEAVDGVENDRQLARFAGELTVGLGVVRQSDANTVDLARLVRERMEQISSNFPPGLRYTIATDDSEFVEESINDLFMTIGIAALLVVLVVFAFLRSGRGTIVTVVAIPTSLAIGMAVISLLGFSINVLSMLGLILAIGILVDDSIVVLERNYYHIERGAEPEPASRVGTTEVAFPAVATTLALGAVFLPVAFTGGIIGRFFLEFGVTVTVTVFASTFVALTLTPVLCSKLLRGVSGHGPIFQWSERIFNRFEEAYGWILAGAFRHRLVPVLAGVGAFALGLLALANVSREFAPMEDRSGFMITFETPQGSTLSETDELARRIESVLDAMPEVQHQFLAIGLAQRGAGSPNRGIAFVRLTPRYERERHQEDVMQYLRARLNAIPHGRVFVMEGGIAGFGGSPVEVVIQQHDLDELARQQEIVMAWLNDRPETFVGVRTNLELNNPQVDVIIDRERASEKGISVADISNTLRFLFGAPAISHVEREAHRYDVITDIVGRGGLTPDVLRDVYVRNGTGSLVSLGGIVTFEETIGPNAINRFNRIRSATISAQTPPGVALGDAVGRLEMFLRAELPPGTTFELAGISQVYEESFYYLAIAIIMSLVFIYLVLAAQFESFVHPFTIMLSLPLAMVGAFGCLWVLGLSFDIYAFIGLILLLGLVVKNSILLVDYTNVLRARGLPVREAAQQAARDRFRAVLMTAISTVLGMMPVALGFGAGGDARIPLGVAVVGGLFGATFLTLVVIPVVYTYVDQVVVFVTRKSGSGKNEAGRVEILEAHS